jgi:hypothetical protein
MLSGIKIADRWYQIEINPEWPASNCFKVVNEDGDQYTIRHDPESGKWYLC